jgi:hypothetical protein
MKKIFLFIISFPLWGLGGFAFAQNTSIDPNFVQIPRLSTAPTCATNDKGKLYFNSNDNKMYFCNGTAWVDFSVGAFALPYSGNANSSGAAFQIQQNGLGPDLNFSINNSSNTNAAVRGFTNGTGFAGAFSSVNANPKALNTLGGLKFEGIGEGSGKILTSDATGNATWQSNTIAFNAYLSSDLNLSHGQSTTFSISGLTEVFDLGNDFSTNFFEAPQDGLYHFDAGVKFGVNGSPSNYSELQLQKCNATFSSCTTMASSKINNQTASQHSLSMTLNLIDGERIRIKAFHTNSTSVVRDIEGQDGNGNRPTYFSGHLIR